MTQTLSSEIEGLLARENLSAAQREEMYALLSQHFEGVTRSQFERDLAEKNWVIQVRREGRLLGFSTLLVSEVSFHDRPLTAIYSGDTIVAPEAWGSSALARGWIAAVNHLRALHPAKPCYWLLLTSGFRTYRFLPVFWSEFFPRYQVPTPPSTRRLLDYLASARYGQHYDVATGIVRFAQPQLLRGILGAIPKGRQSDPDITFFLRQNPGHAEGDELACLCEIDAENLTPAGRRMIL